MKFKCSHCHYDHDVGTQSYMVDQEQGTIVAGPWYREKGLNHQATGCLVCGTIHATAGNALKALLTFFSRALSVKSYITINKLRNAIEEKSPYSFEEGLAEFNFPPVLVKAFFERGYFRRDEKFVIGDANKISAFFAEQYVNFCKSLDAPVRSTYSLNRFIDYGLGRPNSDEAVAVESALAAVDVGMLVWDEVLERAAFVKVASELADTP